MIRNFETVTCECLQKKVALTAAECHCEVTTCPWSENTSISSVPRKCTLWKECDKLESCILTYFWYKQELNLREKPVRYSYWRRATLTNSLCFMNEGTRSSWGLHSQCTEKYPHFWRWSESFKLLMWNEIIKDNMSKLHSERSWNFYEHHPVFWSLT